MKKAHCIRTGFLALASTVLLCCAAAASAASDAGGMAQAHQKAGVACAVCHAKPGVAPQESVCTNCHKPEVLKQQTQNVVPTNPHVSPHYELTCTNCHAGHKPSTDFCAQCHKFDFRVP